jgi:putative hydrolase of the HAD superfamily
MASFHSSWRRAIDASAPTTIVFDGDDTLWRTEPLYDRARREAAHVVAAEGYNPDEFEALQRELDARLVETMGLSDERFPASNVAAFTQIALRAGTSPRPQALARIRRASASVFDAKAVLIPSAREVLSILKETFRLVLLTKGEPRVQNKRVDDSGLARFFEFIEIVSYKNARAFERVLEKAGAVPSSSWSVGNSIPSDVEPSLDAGMRAIWIDAHVWEHERRGHGVDLSNPRLVVASDLEQVPAIVAPSTTAPNETTS